MIINIEKEIIFGNGFKLKVFSIIVFFKVFKILLFDLYINKICVVVCELIINMIDVYVFNGNFEKFII